MQLIAAEEWRFLSGYEVEVSSLGRVRSCDRLVEMPATARTGSYVRLWKGRMLKPWLNQGYPTVTTALGRQRVHRLVCLAWYGPEPPGQPHVLHGDDDPTHNVPSNLRWGTHEENMAEASARGRMGCPPKLTAAQAAQIRMRRKSGESGKTLAEEFGVSGQTICDISKGRTWACNCS